MKSYDSDVKRKDAPCGLIFLSGCGKLAGYLLRGLQAFMFVNNSLGFFKDRLGCEPADRSRAGDVNGPLDELLVGLLNVGLDLLARFKGGCLLVLNVGFSDPRFMWLLLHSESL
jgi:hypothetical protein